MATLLLIAITAGVWLPLCHWISDLIWGLPPVRSAASRTSPPPPGMDPAGGDGGAGMRVQS